MIRTQLGFDVRAADARDFDALKEFHEGLSPTTRYRRFFSGGPRATGALLRTLAGESGADVVVATENGTLIGHAMAADTGDAAEIAVVVADSWQRRGVGAAMVRALVARARARGVTSLVMEVLAENRVVLAMIESHWPSARYDRSAADVTVRMPADLVSAPRRPYTPTVPSMPSRSRSA